MSYAIHSRKSTAVPGHQSTTAPNKSFAGLRVSRRHDVF
jgi:hypothetical protein